MHFIKILPGDVVTLEMSPYDLSRGRITYRQKYVTYESSSISKKNVCKMQDHKTKRCDNGNLRKSKT